MHRQCWRARRSITGDAGTHSWRWKLASTRFMLSYGCASDAQKREEACQQRCQQAADIAVLTDACQTSCKAPKIEHLSQI